MSEPSVVYGDLWELDGDVRCITTNGTVYSDRITQERKNIMGGGCALEAKNIFPWLPVTYAAAIENYGHHVYFFPQYRLVMFPTKQRIEDAADFRTIQASTHELLNLTNIYGWKKVLLPAPGCGLGGLDWDDVYPMLRGLLDERFVIVRYPTEKENKK